MLKKGGSIPGFLKAEEDVNSSVTGVYLSMFLMRTVPYNHRSDDPNKLR